MAPEIYDSDEEMPVVLGPASCDVIQRNGLTYIDALLGSGPLIFDGQSKFGCLCSSTLSSEGHRHFLILDFPGILWCRFGTCGSWGPEAPKEDQSLEEFG